MNIIYQVSTIHISYNYNKQNFKLPTWNMDTYITLYNIFYDKLIILIQENNVQAQA